MKISPNSITTPLTPRQPIAYTQATPRDQGKEGVPEEASAYEPSPQWLRLLDHLRQQPEVREDKVSAAVERCRQGFYATTECLENSAEAMLRTLD